MGTSSFKKNMNINQDHYLPYFIPNPGATLWRIVFAAGQLDAATATLLPVSKLDFSHQTSSTASLCRKAASSSSTASLCRKAASSTTASLCRKAASSSTASLCRKAASSTS